MVAVHRRKTHTMPPPVRRDFPAPARCCARIANSTLRPVFADRRLIFYFNPLPSCEGRHSTSKAEAEAYKKGYDQIASGIPLVVYHEGSKKPPDDSQGMRLLTQNVGQNFITPDLIEGLQNVQAAFRAEIGIPNLLVRKKERLLTDEVNKGDIYTRSKAKLWLDEMRAGMTKCVELFPELDGKFWVDFSQNLNGGAADGGNNVNFGTV